MLAVKRRNAWAQFGCAWGQLTHTFGIFTAVVVLGFLFTVLNPTSESTPATGAGPDPEHAG